MAYRDNVGCTKGDTDWGSTSLTLNAWHHIAISRSGNNWYGFVDGVLDQSFTSSATLSSYGGTINIGHWDSSYTKLPKGYIDNFRVTKGCRAVHICVRHVHVKL